MRRMLEAAAVMAAAMLLSSCGQTPPATAPSSNQPSIPVATQAPPEQPSPIPDALAPFYEQQVEWVDCGGAECTKILVPVDYDDPSGPTIELSALRIPATGERIGSLLVNPGGPGGSAVDYARAADYIVSSDVREAYDIVGVDPRGVGLSAPVECLTDQQRDEFIAVDGTPDSPAEEQQIVDISAELLAGCQDNDPTTFNQVGTTNSARDMDIVRAVLGDKQLNYLGKSYGTMLGAVYAELFPQKVGRMVLDGVLPANLSNEEVTRVQAEGFEEAVDHFVADCLQHEDCPFSGTQAEAKAQFQAFISGLEANPMTGPKGRMLTEAMGAYAILSFLYFPQYDYPRLREGLSAAIKKDDPSVLLDMLDERTSRGPDGRYLDNSLDAFYAITCADRPYGGTVEEARQLAGEWKTEIPTFGQALAWGIVSCAGWPSNGEESITETVARGSNPILVVSTTHDPATPYVWGEQVAATLENGHLITWDGYNHTAYLEGSDCIQENVDAYLLNGTVPPEGLVCK